MAEEKFKRSWMIALAGSLLFLVFLYYARRVVAPFIIALGLAYLFDPVVDRLQKLKMSRTLSVLVLMAGFFLISLGGTLLLFPLFRLQAEQLAENIPEYIRILQEWLDPLVQKIAGLEQSKVQEILNQEMLKFGDVPLKILSGATGILWDSLSGLFEMVLVVANIVIIPVAMFYLLRDYDGINKKLLGLVPERLRDKVLDLLRAIDRVLAGFVRGQLIVALTMAVLYSIGLYLCGTPLSLFIGLVAGLANLVPYLGVVLGLVPAAVLTFMHTQDWIPLLGVAAVFAVVQGLEGMIITPRLVGDNIGLHPVAVMLAVLLGAEFFGMVGVILAVPTVAVLNVLANRGLDQYRKSAFYTT